MNNMLDNAAACRPYLWAVELFAEKSMKLFANQESAGDLGTAAAKAVETSGEQEGPEGCLSVPGESGFVPRPTRLIVKAQDRSGKPTTYRVDGFKARAFCHEMDHLDGVLYIDKLVPPPEEKRR